MWFIVLTLISSNSPVSVFQNHFSLQSLFAYSECIWINGWAFFLGKNVPTKNPYMIWMLLYFFKKTSDHAKQRSAL
jgi:hypothetical protein